MPGRSGPMTRAPSAATTAATKTSARSENEAGRANAVKDRFPPAASPSRGRRAGGRRADRHFMLWQGHRCLSDSDVAAAPGRLCRIAPPRPRPPRGGAMTRMPALSLAAVPGRRRRTLDLARKIEDLGFSGTSAQYGRRHGAVRRHRDGDPARPVRHLDREHLHAPPFGSRRPRRSSTRSRRAASGSASA